MPVHQGIAGLSLHHFNRIEARRLLVQAGFKILKIEPLGLGKNAKLRIPWLLPWLRAYGYLVAAEKDS
jgi:hypothetical protein